MMTPEERSKFFENLPVYPDSTPAIIHRPSRRFRFEVAVDRLAAPIWHMLYRLTGK